MYKQILDKQILDKQTFGQADIGQADIGQADICTSRYWTSRYWTSRHLDKQILDKQILGKQTFGQADIGQADIGQADIWTSRYWTSRYWTSRHLDKQILDKQILDKQTFGQADIGQADIGLVMAGDVQDNDTDFHYPLKTNYRKLEMELMLEKLRQHPEAIPSPSREEMMATFDKSWSTVCANLDAADVFKRNMITLNFDGSEDHQASQKLISLVGKEMFRPSSIQALNAFMEPPDRVKRNWNAVIGDAPFDEGMELIDGEYGDLEDLQRELQLIVDTEEDIDVDIMVVDVDMDSSKAVVENLVNTVSKIVQQEVHQNSDLMFVNKLEVLLTQI